MGSEVSSQKGSSEKKKGQNKAKSEKSAIRNDDKLNQDQFNRRRRSSSIEFDQSFNIDSGLTKPIGGPSTSTTTKPNHGKEPKTQKSKEIPKQIIVVNENADDTDEEEPLDLPPMFKPLIPIGHETLSQSHPQINPIFIQHFGLIIEDHLRGKAEAVSKQQQPLIETIKNIDVSCMVLSNQIVGEKHKKFIKLSDSFSKLNDISKLIEKCDHNLEHCLKKIEILNNNLPDELKLERIQF